jgi:hypothetical protein
MLGLSEILQLLMFTIAQRFVPEARVFLQQMLLAAICLADIFNRDLIFSLIYIIKCVNSTCNSN